MKTTQKMQGHAVKSKQAIRLRSGQAIIGVFGGSGFYDLLKNVKEVSVTTPYGQPSAKIAIGEYDGKKIAFLPRHGKKHSLPPHKIPYRANLFAFKKLGVERIIAPCAAGSLQARIKPGDFVICDHFVDRTNGRSDTFFEGPQVAHISAADTYCSELKNLARKCCQKFGIKAHTGGTVVVINGPRFSTKSESKFYQSQGWDVINMTQYPECILAKELEMCYVNISLITDYDAGPEGNKKIKPVTMTEVARVFKENNEKVKKLIFEMIKHMPVDRQCGCDHSLNGAMVG